MAFACGEYSRHPVLFFHTHISDAAVIRDAVKGRRSPAYIALTTTLTQWTVLCVVLLPKLVPGERLPREAAKALRISKS